MNKFILFFLLCPALFVKANCATYYVFPHPQFHTYPVGLFAVFCMCLGILDKYENSCAGIEVDFGKEGLYYDARYGKNWWEYYFSPIKFATEDPSKTKKITPEKAIALGAQLIAKPRERSVELVKKYIQVKPHILAKVDAFAKKFTSPVVIGVHYRGTDKVLEVQRVPYELIFDQINEVISWQLESDFQIFVATDEQAFLDDISLLYPGKIVCTEAYRSVNGQPVHYGNNFSPYEKGEQAIVDCLLLSRCHLLIRTPDTSLSLVSTYFNPDLQVLTVKNE